MGKPLLLIFMKIKSRGFSCIIGLSGAQTSQKRRFCLWGLRQVEKTSLLRKPSPKLYFADVGVVNQLRNVDMWQQGRAKSPLIPRQRVSIVDRNDEYPNDSRANHLCRNRWFDFVKNQFKSRPTSILTMTGSVTTKYFYITAILDHIKFHNRHPKSGSRLTTCTRARRRRMGIK
jgi:hypothetical protein